ncbi:MAG TPA: CheR family methyltransferase, partial [Pyrinomonadaceae bacterium]|nr:CheR family methyltransferase [Pyrinomonadaceae bacterium]
EILQTTSLIPVTQVKERVKVNPDHVYVIPPNQNLAMTDGHLQLKDMIGIEERRSPVDLFFRTLADTNDSRAVSVILSGTGANGSMGLKRIKESGGVAFVQDPNEAQYTDMPRNAIATGLVDYVLPVRDIPAKILSYKEHRSSILLADAPEVKPTEEQALRDIFTQLRMRTGHDFSNYKRATILRRIERRLGIKELKGLPEYANFLRENQEEAQALLKDLLISVTNFFRDPASIEAVARTVLPAIFFNKEADDAVRVWIAGCATGEEAYSIAMILSEASSHLQNPAQIQLFATDIDENAIAIAREGFYSEAEVVDVSPERLRRFFKREHEGYRVRRELRENVLFAVHNVIKDPPFSHLDLISCRNLLIYLNRSAQTRVLEVMHFALNATGYLFLGSSESIEGSLDLFTIVDKEHHIFQSRPVPTRATLPVPEVTLRPLPPPQIGKERTPQEMRAMERLSYVDLHQRILEKFGPPSVIINEDYDIVHLSDSVGRYLKIAGGEPTNNLLKLIRPELRLDVRTALYQAIQKRGEVETTDLAVRIDDGSDVNLRVTVRPVLREGDPTRGFILVLFEEHGVPASSLKKPDTVAEPIARQLEDELMHLKSQLRATVEQYEIQQEELRASNEELQAINEELRSAAEELETSKEELQSVNEELTTVNQELKIKIEELSQANNDFMNLMNSTDIGTIFLDRGLRVKLFTPRARDIFNLIDSDIGRPLMDITSKLAHDHIVKDIQQVTKTLQKVETLAESVDGRWFTMRILPYRTREDRIDGVVITFLDITENRIAKAGLEKAHAELENRVAQRTSDLADANASLWLEVSERRLAESSRVKLLNQLVTSQEKERQRFARDLHDQLGQQLTILRLKLETLKDESGQRQKLSDRIEEILEVLSHLDSDIDFLAWELRPVILDDLGLKEALRLYVDRWKEHSGIAAEFHSTGFNQERLPVETENNLYRITQEALNNVAKHSNGSRVSVLLERRGDHAVLIIEDNGQGFKADDKDLLDSGFGLKGMRERALLIGAAFEVETNAKKGTTIFVRAPLTVSEGEEELK